MSSHTKLDNTEKRLRAIEERVEMALKYKSWGNAAVILHEDINWLIEQVRSKYSGQELPPRIRRWTYVSPDSGAVLSVSEDDASIVVHKPGYYRWL